ncbi:hypothetical protein [Micromonospora cathayae]|uniref:Uncharacterized protein n=1 Tax=Micromonospora cathayae TaxID=3028804 RepID=A0ABY7ZN96_9ACTN|nr:hypothetical protein [Micromonospora sp. HUAS 3]WDZ83973.1 hypothetical protein PVK37_26455 [Micromonospora sp. HUAS 3]
MMIDQTAQAQDWIAAAAHAELDAIQRRVEETWDIEASLREILLEEHYHAFVEERTRSFDAKASLADILASDVAGVGPLGMVWSSSEVADSPKAPRRAQARHCGAWEPASDPIDQVRQVAAEATVALLAIKKAETTAATPDYIVAMTEATRRSVELLILAEDLDRKLISKEDALDVVHETAGALLDLCKILDNQDDPSVENAKHFIRVVFTLATDANRLKSAIKCLFDPSDDTVGSLL